MYIFVSFLSFEQSSKIYIKKGTKERNEKKRKNELLLSVN